MTEQGPAAQTNDTTASDEGLSNSHARFESLLAEARDQIVQLDWASATRTLNKVARLLPKDPRSPSDAAIHVEWLIASAGVAAEARHDSRDPWALLDQAATFQQQFGLNAARTRLVAQRAFLHQRAGNLDDALAELAAIGTDLEDCPAATAVKVLLNRGTLHLEVGSVEAAVVDLEAARRRALGAGLDVQASTARHNLGWAEYLRGDLPRALSLVGGVDLDVDDDVTNHPVALMDRAQVLAEAGLVDEANQLLQRATTGLVDSGSLRDEGEARLARARVALVADDLETALVESRAAARCMQRLGNQRWHRRAEMTRLATMVEMAQADQRRQSVEQTFLQVLRAEVGRFVSTVEKSDDRMLVVPSRLMAAEAALVDGDVDAAVRVLNALTIGASSSVSVRMRWHRVRAEVAVRTAGHVGEVVATGLDELGQAQSQLGSMDLRTAIAIHGKELAQIGVDWALRHGDPDEVHLAVERARASSSRLSPVRADLDPIDRDLLARLRRATGALERLDSGQQPEPFERLKAEVADVRARLRSRTWGQAGQVGTRKDVIDLDAAEAALTVRSATAVTFATAGNDELRAVVVSGTSGLRVVPLGLTGRKIAADVARLRSDMTALLLAGVPDGVRRAMRASMQRTLQQLDDRLLTPLDLPSDGEVVVVTTASLALVPWGLLPSLHRRATSVAPCLTDWCNSQGGGPRQTSGVTAIAGPRLERAIGEAVAVGAHWEGASVIQAQAATTSAARSALRSARVVHLALHGRHRERSPLFSSIELVDGELFAHEVTNDVQCDLVVLSACEVGASQVREGDEALGLTAALHQAGARTVVAGLAPVRDDVAHDTMVEFHARVASGVSPSAALGEAIAAAWDAGAVAPFTCVGAGAVPIGASA